MTPDRYKKVKEIFLEACDKPQGEQAQFIATAAAGDAEIQKEVEGLLKEHLREAQVIPAEPEGPLGPMSAILSRAGVQVPGANVGSKEDITAAWGGDSSEVQDHPDSGSHANDDEAHDQTSGTHSGIVDPGRFPAGTMVAGRYRIIEMLGRGGMGEVYRADDITLNQSVALKFLPALFGSDAKWLERFRNEVRLARQVTHPNVCRVFDIGEYKGEQFLSMEYVDGENLASLLRRIGRVPHDKAILLARQLCAGIAAAHDRGVLHRDLKPANVMIDGRGSVRITDFGLAAPVDQLKTDQIRAGTPAYMSPEQLAGKAVTIRSDVYSLGLVLYEMFTGRRAFKADSLKAYQKLHSSEDPTPPSEILEDIDPIVDRVIMRCLEKEPKDRPASVMAVSAALPGGNPLQEILAAGETPSPEVVAAAGEAHGVMRPRLALALLITALACLVGFVAVAKNVFVIQRALYNQPRDPDARNAAALTVDARPEVLQFRAQELLAKIGYTYTPRDTARGFDLNRGYYLHEENQKDRSLRRLSRSRLGLVYFWYRQSPELLIPARAEGSVGEHDPATGQPGMINVRLDTAGRLIGLEVEPSTPSRLVPEPETLPATSGTAPVASTGVRVDWAPLLAAAEIDLTKGHFEEVEPEGTPTVYADRRIAWRGHFTDGTSVDQETVRVEAAAYQGKPVYFAIIGNWKEEQLSEDRAEILSVGEWNLVIQTLVTIALLLVGGYLAFKNYHSGRGDRQGAGRMALAFFLLGVVAWVCSAHHVSDLVLEFLLFRRGLGPVLYAVSLMWIFYMAMEPYVRRIWPETVISWTRLLAGKWTDPLVGRDVLAGASVGVMSTLLSVIEYQVPQWNDEKFMPVPLPSILSASRMLNATQNFSGIFNSAIVSLYFGLILLLCLVLLRIATRRLKITWTVAIILFAVATAHYRVETPWILGAENIFSLLIQAILALTLLLLLNRHGLVALIFCLLVRAFLMDFPVTWNLTVWYKMASLAGIVPTVLILLFSYYTARGGKIAPPAPAG